MAETSHSNVLEKVKRRKALRPVERERGKKSRPGNLGGEGRIMADPLALPREKKRSFLRSGRKEGGDRHGATSPMGVAANRLFEVREHLRLSL